MYQSYNIMKKAYSCINCKSTYFTKMARNVHEGNCLRAKQRREGAFNQSFAFSSSSSGMNNDGNESECYHDLIYNFESSDEVDQNVHDEEYEQSLIGDTSIVQYLDYCWLGQSSLCTN